MSSFTRHNLVKHSEHSGFQCLFCCRTFAYSTKKKRYKQPIVLMTPQQFFVSVVFLNCEINQVKNWRTRRKPAMYVCRKTLSSKYTLYKNATALKTLLNVFLCKHKLMRGSLRNHQKVHITKLEKITKIES